MESWKLRHSLPCSSTLGNSFLFALQTSSGPRKESKPERWQSVFHILASSISTLLMDSFLKGVPSLRSTSAGSGRSHDGLLGQAPARGPLVSAGELYHSLGGRPCRDRIVPGWGSLD